MVEKYNEHVARVLQGVGCPDKIDFGRWMRDEGGRSLRDAEGSRLERQGWVELSRDQLQLLTAKLGACSNVKTIDLSSERCSAASCNSVCIRCVILLIMIVFRVQDWMRRLRCACWGSARALCIAEHHTRMCVGGILLCGVGRVVLCVIESLLIWDCFQTAILEAKAALRLLGHCKGTLHCRSSILNVREGYFVLRCVLCGVCV